MAMPNVDISKPPNCVRQMHGLYLTKAGDVDICTMPKQLLRYRTKRLLIQLLKSHSSVTGEQRLLIKECCPQKQLAELILFLGLFVCWKECPGWLFGRCDKMKYMFDDKCHSCQFWQLQYVHKQSPSHGCERGSCVLRSCGPGPEGGGVPGEKMLDGMAWPRQGTELPARQMCDGAPLPHSVMHPRPAPAWCSSHWSVHQNHCTA